MNQKFGIFTHGEALQQPLQCRQIYVINAKPFIILGTRDDGRRWIASDHTSLPAARRALKDWLRRYPNAVEG